MRSLTPLLLGAFLAMPVVAVAQERTAGHNLALEASWNALKTLVDQANAQARVATTTANDARTRADNAMNRANEAHTLAGQAHALASGAQATANQAMQGVNNAAWCARHKMLFDGTSCQRIETGSNFRNVSYYGSAARSDNTTVVSGWHSLCVMAFNHNDSNFWLSVAEGPNAEGKSRWQAHRGAGYAEPRMLCLD